MKPLNFPSAKRPIRRIVQAGFFLFVLLTVLAPALTRLGLPLPFGIANLHAVCPFGAVESLGRLILEGKLVPKLHQSNIWMLLAVLGSTALLGAVFCGWLCPLGSIQEWLGALGRRIFGRRYNRFIPEKLDRLLGFLRYGVLALVMVQTTRLVTLVFSSVDPYFALFHFWSGQALPSALAVLGLVLVASLFVERPWCRWLCPFGAVQGLVQLLSPWKIRRDPAACSSCRLCTRACPMHIAVHEKNVVLDTRCNRCGRCLEACPRPAALDHCLPLPGGRAQPSGPAATKPSPRRLSIRNRLATAAVVLVLFAAPIVISRQAGLFTTSERPVITAERLSPERIKATMTLQDLAQGFDCELPALVSYLGLPPGLPADTRLQDLEDEVEELTTRVIRERMAAFRQG